MAHKNSFHEKREEQHNTHNRRAGVAKFKRNLGHRKRRRWDNRIRKTWVEDRELREFGRTTGDSRNNKWQGTEGTLPLT